MQFIVEGQRIATENFVPGRLYTILFKTETQVNLTCISTGAGCVTFKGEAPINLFTLSMRNADTIDTIEPTQLGTNNYNNLINKPAINGVDLIGNKTSAALGIREVPEAIETDNGKVLTADSVGSYSWQVIPEGTTDYTDLSNKPQIAGVTLTGNISLADLGAAAASDIPTTPGDIGAEPAITSDNKLDPSLIDYDSTHAAITSAQVEQIGTNQTNISNIQTAFNSYHKASGTDIFFSETEPTGTITEGSYWISTTATKIYSKSANIATGLTWESGTIYRSGDNSPADDNAIRTVGYINCSPDTTYTFDANTTLPLTAARVNWYTADNTGIDRISVFTNRTFTTPSNCTKIRISVECENIGVAPIVQLTPVITYMLWT